MNTTGHAAKNRRRRNRRWHLPRPTLATRGAISMLLVLLEGWFLSYACTHTRLALPYGSPQWAITGSVIIACILPILLILVTAIGDDNDQ